MVQMIKPKMKYREKPLRKLMARKRRIINKPKRRK